MTLPSDKKKVYVNAYTEEAGMSAAKKIKDYIEPKPKRRLLQVKIERELVEMVNKKKKTQGLTWVRLLKGMFKKYLEE